MTPSPCRYICQMDPATQLCQGCYRTIDEIASWSKLPDAARQKIINLIKARRQEHAPEEPELHNSTE